MLWLLHTPHIIGTFVLCYTVPFSFSCQPQARHACLPMTPRSLVRNNVSIELLHRSLSMIILTSPLRNSTLTVRAKFSNILETSHFRMFSVHRVKVPEWVPHGSHIVFRHKGCLCCYVNVNIVMWTFLLTPCMYYSIPYDHWLWQTRTSRLCIVFHLWFQGNCRKTWKCRHWLRQHPKQVVMFLLIDLDRI